MDRSRLFPTFAAGVLALLSAAPHAAAVQYYLAVDVPTTLGGITYTPSQILRVTDGVYAVELELETGTAHVAAMLRTPEGPWLLTPSDTIVTDEVTVETRDIILDDPVNETVSFALHGSSAGIPAYAAIDALLYDPVTDQIAISFDVPVRLGMVDYGPSDLVAIGAGFSLLWSGATYGVPASANVIGAEMDSAGRLVLSFDAPVTLGATTFLPGQLVAWDAGTGFSLYAADPFWPPSSLAASFSFLPAAGEVPDGGAGSVPLTVAPAPGGDLTLSWGASCAGTDTDYAIYEGILGAPFNSHVPVTCSTGGATTWTFTPSPGDRYYYVVPRNGVTEGSYGRGSDGLQHPPSSSACLPQEVALICE